MAVIREKTDVDVFTFQGRDYKLEKISEGPYFQHWAGEGVLMALGKSESRLDKAMVIIGEKVYDIVWPITAKRVDFLSDEARVREVSQRTPLDVSPSRPLIEIVDSLRKFAEKNPEVKEWLIRPKPEKQPVLK